MSDLRGIGETALIERLVKLAPAGEMAAGPGDDCAVIDRGGEMLELLKTDALIEGVHFTKEMGAERVGWKAIARVVSDFAAMGGAPDDFLITVAAPGNTEVSWLENFYRGAGKCMEKFGGKLAGGETCKVPDGAPMMFSIAATGSVKRGQVIERSSGKPGDSIWVTGELGGSFVGKHLDFTPRLEEAQWLVEHFRPSSMMDLSDGLAADLPKLARASGCGFHFDETAIPRTANCDLAAALNDGEDFELLFTSPSGKCPIAEWFKVFPETKLTKIGELVPAGQGAQLDGGWDHFG